MKPPNEDPDEINMNQYQAATGRTAVYPGAGSRGSQRTPSELVTAVTYLGLGLGEAGEIQGKIKKVLRDDNGVISDARRDEIVAELGDLLWYLARLAAELDTPLSEVARHNLAKLESRAARGALQGSGDQR